MVLLKVFTSSFSIKAALGNLKISDDSLRSSHPYFWVCDMRNPGGRSFVEVLHVTWWNDYALHCFFFLPIEGLVMAQLDKRFSKCCAD